MGNTIYRVQNKQKQHPQWAVDGVIYELNIRQFSSEGTFKAAAKELTRLKKLGVDIIWLMPIFPIGELRRKGSLGSYYSIKDYTAVNPEFGTLGDLKNFIKSAQKLGIHVILDWVANHTSRDARWVREHPEWYVWDEEKAEIATPFDWSDTAKLDYSKDELWREMIASMKYWVEEVGMDGFRCDMAMLVPLKFWEQATAELTVAMKALDKELFMLAEAEGSEFHTAFDATYCWEEHHILGKIATGEANCFTLGERLMYENSQYNGDALRMHFIENHDENSWNGSAVERLAGGVEAFAALSYLLSGMPLIYNGTEVGLDRRLAFFDKDEIGWARLRGGERGANIEKLFTLLGELKHSHPSLRGGSLGADIEGIDNDNPHNIFAIRRDAGDGRVVIGVFNLSGWEQRVRVTDTNFEGDYRELVSKDVVPLSRDMVLGAWEFRVYYR